eukprot:TRINITY_DN3504_c0_g1_i5.p1 TRINITY_DN3504_c0_g1~~TRINITY_DN3504_c0_g1_i5.p1  ORF type:complete len:167 (+),score=12.99 TRINITY_DN3504_c0_g1_i5:360-860(+)
MAERGLQLLGAKPSPYVTRVMLSLSLKGIPYEFVPENLMNKSELLLRSNPVHKKVPVLIHDGKALSESLVILEYIEDAWPSNGSRLLSSDPYQRAQARFWAAFVDGKVMGCFSVLQKLHQLLFLTLSRFCCGFTVVTADGQSQEDIHEQGQGVAEAGSGGGQGELC